MRISIQELAARLDISQQKISYWMNKVEEIKELFDREGKKFVIREKNIPKFEKLVAENRLRIPLGQWTQTALECRERNCICEGCMMNEFCSKFEYPPMKAKVLELVRLYGEPKRR